MKESLSVEFDSARFESGWGSGWKWYLNKAIERVRDADAAKFLVYLSERIGIEVDVRDKERQRRGAIKRLRADIKSLVHSLGKAAKKPPAMPGSLRI